MTHVWTTSEWEIPAEHCRPGFNRLAFVSAGGVPDVAIAVASLSFELKR